MAPYVATGRLKTTFYASAYEQLAKVLDTGRSSSCLKRASWISDSMLIDRTFVAMSSFLPLVDMPETAGPTFKRNANPESAEGIGATGEVFYYSEPDAAIFFSKDGPASPEDEVL
jgi:hypothetical protein